MESKETEPASLEADDFSGEIPSQRETLAETIGSLFSISKNGVWAVVIFALGIVTLGWLADSVLPLLHDVGTLLVAKQKRLQAATTFKASFAKLVLPAIWFFLLIVVLHFIRRRNLAPTKYETIVPNPHKGLIVMLSPYSQIPKTANCYSSPKELVSAIDSNTIDLDSVLSRCNWGQLAFVVGYHASAPLTRCWLVTTKDKSHKEYEHAKRLIEFLVKSKEGVDVECAYVRIQDENDIGETAQAISRLYKRIEGGEFGINTQDVIADFTGGTSAMTGGMILATLDEGREVEYVTRREPILTAGITSKDIRERGLIISPRTSPRMVRKFGKG